MTVPCTGRSPIGVMKRFKRYDFRNRIGGKYYDKKEKRLKNTFAVGKSAKIKPTSFKDVIVIVNNAIKKKGYRS